MEKFFIFLCVVSIIILIFRIGSLKKRTQRAEKELDSIKSQLRDLYDKSYYMYDILEGMGAAPARKRKVSQSKNVPVSQESNVPLQNKTAPASSQNIAAAADAHASVSAPNTPISLEKIPAAQPTSPYIGQPYSGTAGNTSAPAPDHTASHSHVQAPSYAAAQTANAPIKPPIQKKPRKNIEEWLGARVFNVAASLLIFIGLVLFCTLSTDVVTNTMKMIAMFVVSGGFIGVGAFLARRDRSVFPMGMLGTGFGSFFISILLSHIYFHSLGDIAAFGLILVWSALALFMSKKLDSVMLSVTAHIGTAVSICFAFTLGFTAQRVILLTVYLMAALAVIIVGNIFCCRKTYRFGLIMSQVLLLYTSIAMSHAFSEKFIMPESISVPAAIIIYAVQFAAVCFVSHLVSTSASALEKEGGKFTSAAFVVQAVNKLLWTAGTVSTVGMITFFICKNALHTKAEIPVMVSLAATALLHLALTLFWEEKFNFSESLSTVSLWFVSLLLTGALFTGSHNSGLPFLFIYSLLLIGIFKYTKHKGLVPLTAAMLVIEAVYMSIYGYFKIENVWISIPYMFAMGVVLLLLWFSQSGEDKQRTFKYMKIAEYIWLSVSIIAINASEFSEISIPLIISEFALMNIICYFIKFGGKNEPELRTVVYAESLLTVFVGILSLAFESTSSLGDNNIIKAVLVVMVALISAVYIYDFGKSRSTLLQVLAAITAAFYFSSFSLGFRDHFKLCEIYVDVLHFNPFLFIFTAAILTIFYLTKNSRLTKFIWIGMILDMASMGLFGYGNLVNEALWNETQNKTPLHIIFTGLSLAHAVTMLGASFLMTSLCESLTQNSQDKKSYEWRSYELSHSLSRFVSYFWINLSFPTVAYWALYNTSLTNYKITFALIILAAVNTAVFALHYQDKHGTPFNYTVRITSSIVLYSALPFLSSGLDGTNGEYAACVLLMLILAALFFVKARDLLKANPNILIQLYIGFTSTIFINFVCNGLSKNYNAAYIFSIVTMITALICITVGFIARAKGLRVYGLIVMMLCIIKLVTYDISGADSLARVLAFIVGGIICFIISGIYNKMEKKFNSLSEQPVMSTVSVNQGGLAAIANAYSAQKAMSEDAPITELSPEMLDVDDVVTETVSVTTVPVSAVKENTNDDCTLPTNE